jgi:ankyrin repeat protein
LGELIASLSFSCSHLDKEGRTALFYAAEESFEDICLELIANGANPHLKDDVSSHPLSLISL